MQTCLSEAVEAPEDANCIHRGSLSSSHSPGFLRNLSMATLLNSPNHRGQTEPRGCGNTSQNLGSMCGSHTMLCHIAEMSLCDQHTLPPPTKYGSCWHCPGQLIVISLSW